MIHNCKTNSPSESEGSDTPSPLSGNDSSASIEKKTETTLERSTEITDPLWPWRSPDRQVSTPLPSGSSTTTD